jgi:hypothetical protein
MGRKPEAQPSESLQRNESKVTRGRQGGAPSVCNLACSSLLFQPLGWAAIVLSHLFFLFFYRIQNSRQLSQKKANGQAYRRNSHEKGDQA